MVRATSFLSLVPSLQEVQREGGACLEFQKPQVLPAPRRNCSVEATAGPLPPTPSARWARGGGRWSGMSRTAPQPLLEKPDLWASEIQWTLFPAGPTLRYLWALGSQMGIGSCQG